MKLLLFVATLFLIVSGLFAQKLSSLSPNYSGIDKRMMEIPVDKSYSIDSIASYIGQNFGTPKEQLRAVFFWVAKNIKYDVKNMFLFDYNESDKELANKTLVTRKGVCAGYAAVFHDLCTKLQIEAYIITGYTKQRGFVDYIAHAWCGVYVDSGWYFVDPTWGAGYIQNGQFFSTINNDYFLAAPQKLIKSHMPFDPIWQFSKQPINNYEFVSGKSKLTQSGVVFEFADSLKQHLQATEVNRLQGSLRRLEQAGVNNAVVLQEQTTLRVQLENIKRQNLTNNYNEAINNYNAGINQYNDFIQFRNKQFSPKKTDAEISEMINEADKLLKLAGKQLDELQVDDQQIRTQVSQLKESVDKAMVNVKEQQDFVTKYLNTSKAFRKSLFYKYTIAGVPVN